MVDHPILLRGLGLLGANGQPTILERTDQQFLEAVLDELSGPDGVRAVESTVAQTHEDGSLKLFQPVHRTFHIALFEAVCDTWGTPRLDPDAIESAGLVVRRVGTVASGLSATTLRQQMQGWMHTDASIQGWMALESSQAEEQDPEVARRPLALRSGNSEIDRQLNIISLATTPASERTAALYVAPPEVCEATGKTILYGLVPVTSTEISEAPPALPDANSPSMLDYRSKVSQHLPPHLKSGARPSMPRAGETLTYSDAGDSRLAGFIKIVQQIAVELDAFGESAESLALFSGLEQIEIDLPAGGSMGAGSFFQQARDVLLEQQGIDGGTVPQLEMPDTWPSVSRALADQILSLVMASFSSRVAALQSGEKRFDGEDNRFCVRGFVRVNRQVDCPPELVWSDYSEQFKIAPWYDSSSHVPPAQISLPDIFDRDKLAQLKPNVAFQVPEQLFNLMNNNSPDDFMDGNASSGPGIALHWICSFSIPIITICAFLVLNIFLELFNIIFRWLLYIKICIPIPLPSNE